MPGRNPSLKPTRKECQQEQSRFVVEMVLLPMTESSCRDNFPVCWCIVLGQETFGANCFPHCNSLVSCVGLILTTA